MKYSKIVQTSYFVVMALVFSCQAPLKEVNIPMANKSELLFSVQDGIVHFKDADSYLKAIEYARQLSDDGKASLCSGHGFISFFYEYKTAMQNLDTAHKDQFKKYISFADGVPGINFVTPAIAAVANQDGLLYIGKSLVRFVDDNEIIVKDGSVDKAMNWQRYKNSSDVFVVSTDISTLNSADSKARVSTSSLCRRIWGTSGNTSIFHDGATVETKIKRTPIPIGYNDTYKVYLYAISTGTSVESSYFGSHSRNNTLTVSYIYDSYDWNNQITATKQLRDITTNTGNRIVYQDSGIDAGNCYSFQVPYYYANLRPAPIVSPCGLWVACQYEFTKYVNDKFTVAADCTSDTQNEY